MRVLHINGRYFSAGGAETYIGLLADAQRRAGHEASLLYASDPPAGPPAWENVYFLPPSSGIRSGLRHKRRFMDLVGDLRPDIIHCHVVQYSVSPLILSALARTYPTVYSAHDTLAFCLKEPDASVEQPLPRVLPSGIPCRDPVGRACMRHGCHHQVLATRSVAGSVHRFLEVAWRRNVLRRLERFIVNSRFTRDELVRNGFAPERIDVIAPSLPVPSSWNRTARARSPQPVILCVGHLAPVKGTFALLEALTEIRHLRWTAELVGGGSAGERLRKAAHGLGLAGRVRFHGAVERERLDSFYRAADLLVIPSLAPESWGFVGIEAMHFGLPVVAFDAGATVEWLAHGETGILVRAGDVNALAAALARVLGDEPLRQRLGQEAARRGPRFVGGQLRFAERVEQAYLQARTAWVRAHEDRY